MALTSKIVLIGAIGVLLVGGRGVIEILDHTKGYGSQITQARNEIQSIESVDDTVDVLESISQRIDDEFVDAMLIYSEDGSSIYYALQDKTFELTEMFSEVADYPELTEPLDQAVFDVYSTIDRLRVEGEFSEAYDRFRHSFEKQTR